MRQKRAESKTHKWNQLYNQAVEANPAKAKVSTVGSEPQPSVKVEIKKIGDLIHLFLKLLSEQGDKMHEALC